MKQLLKISLVWLVLLFATPAKTYAVCPVCTIAVGAGLGLSRWLGIDDTVSGVWVGGLILSMSFWLDSWLEKKKVTFPYRKHISVLAMYLLTVLPLWYGGILGHPFNTLLGVDKFLFGIVVGSATFLAGLWADKKVRQVKGNQLFNFQKVIFPVVSLLLASLILFVVTSVNIAFV